MKTEINGDFRGYALRFSLPSAGCFMAPLKSAGVILLAELLLSGVVYLLGIETWTLALSLLLSMVAVVYYIKVLYKNFWNVVLEESKGLFADLLLWIYYILVCVVSLSPAIVTFLQSGK
jgi:hypothetical protein